MGHQYKSEGLPHGPDNCSYYSFLAPPSFFFFFLESTKLHPQTQLACNTAIFFPPILVWGGHHSKVPQMGWLEQQPFIFSQFGRLEV